MARIRTIKPEFFTSEDIVSLTPLARVFYIALWCEADREGRLDWKPVTLKMRYLPGDNCSVGDLADELIQAGLIVLYDVEGKRYAEIPTFKTHQVINNRESESTRPARNFDASSRVKAEGREGKEGREGNGKEGNGKEGEGREEAPRKRDAAPRIEKPDEVDQQTWNDWLTLRKAKKAPVTDTVIASARREADAAGMPLDAFLQVWCMRGSQGLQADWLQPHERQVPSRAGPAETAHARKMRETVEGLAPGVARRRPGPATPVTIDLETPHVPAIASH